MITPEEMKAAVVKLRAEKRKIQEKINLYNLCLKEVAKASRKPPKVSERSSKENCRLSN